MTVIYIATDVTTGKQPIHRSVFSEVDWKKIFPIISVLVINSLHTQFINHNICVWGAPGMIDITYSMFFFLRYDIWFSFALISRRVNYLCAPALRAP